MEVRNENISIPDFSIIVPVYNISCKYLSKCLESLKNQTHYNIEIIIVNDGSTNGCDIICDKYSQLDSRFKVIHQENKGVSFARNLGIKKALASWIIFVDPDDWVDINMCEELYKHLNKKHLDILLFTYVSEYKEKSFPRFYGNKTEFIFSKEEHENLQKSIMRNYKGYNPLMIGSVWGKVFNREFLIKNNIMFNIKLRKSQDLVFCLYAIEHASKIGYLNRAYYHYRIHESSITHKFNKDIFKYINSLINEVEIFIKKFNKGITYIQSYYNMVVSFLIDNMILDFFHKDNTKKYSIKRKEFLNLIKSEPYKTALEKCNSRVFGKKDRFKIFLLRKKLFLSLLIIYKLKN